MARDFRPKDKSAQGKKSQPQHNAGGQKRDFRPKERSASASHGFAKPARDGKSHSRSFGREKAQRDEDGDDGDEADEGTEAELKEAIAALGGEAGDLELVSSKALRGSKLSQGNEDDGVDSAGLGDELKAFMKGLNLPTDQVAPPKASGASASAKVKATQSAQASMPKTNGKTEPTSKQVEPAPAPSNAPADSKRSKKAEKEDRKRTADVERVKAEENKQRTAKVAAIASKADAAGPSKKASASQLLLAPTPQWMDTQLDALSSGEPASSTSSSSSTLSHDQVLSLLGRGTLLVETDNKEYHTLLNSGSAKMTSQLGGLTPSDAKFISSLLGDTSSVSGSGGQGGTLSDRIAAHALLLGSSPIHNLRSLDALIAMSSKKNREESGRATRALADWFAGSGLGRSGRKLRYFRDQPELAATAMAPFSPSRDQRLALFAYEDRLKKTYFAFLQILETQSHDNLPFVRQQAVAQVFILLREKSEQEQNLLRLLVNKLGDGERSVASKATNNLLELLNVHPNMKSIVAREVGDLIHKPTRSSTRTDSESTKRHQNHAKYYGVLMLNQIMLTRQDIEVANLLVSLYFELFEEALNSEAFGKTEEDANDEKSNDASKPKVKNRWHEGKKGRGKKASDGPPKVVADAEGKMMAAILTGVRRAFPFANLDANVFDKHMNTLFRITHSSSFNIAVQALQLLYVVSTSSETSSAPLLDRFHSSLYSSMLDPRLGTTSKTAMYLNLCYKAMRHDADDDRRAAEVKRLVQILCQMDVEFVCGALFLIGELVRAHPRLRAMLNNPEDDDEEIIVNPPDEEDAVLQAAAAGADAEKSTARKGLATSSYDGLKRDPRFAKASGTCLWEIAPLLEHYHPTVRLLASQLVRNESLTTTPDLTLYSLSHFLDRFVYRNAKKKGTLQKGASGMQPAIAAGAGGEDGVRKVKGWQASGNDEVNTEQFWKKKVADVPVDSLFFHHYFTLKAKRDGQAGKNGAAAKADDDDGSVAASEDEDASAVSDDRPEQDADSDGDGDGDSPGSDDEEEKEIWKAMKASMPAEDGDADLLSDDDDDEGGDDDDEDLAMYDYTDSEDEDGGVAAEDAAEADGGRPSASSDGSDDDEDGVFDEDEDDLLPFADFGSGSEGEDDSDEEAGADDGAVAAGQKRGRAAEEPKSKSQLRRAERKKRKAMPTFASAEDYAHLLGGDDDDDAM
ncbi:unnamed protein product [Parajaminaea phylloscopi]